MKELKRKIIGVSIRFILVLADIGAFGMSLDLTQNVFDDVYVSIQVPALAMTSPLH